MIKKWRFNLYRYLYVIYKEIFAIKVGTAFDDRIDSFGKEG